MLERNQEVIMSTNTDEMTKFTESATKSLIDRQKEQIDTLISTLENATRRIQHYEETIRHLRKERNDIYHAEIKTITLTSDFINREYKYLSTINNLIKDKNKLLEDAAKANKEESKEAPQSAFRPIHITPSYSNIQTRERDAIHMEYNYRPRSQQHWQKK